MTDAEREARKCLVTTNGYQLSIKKSTELVMLAIQRAEHRGREEIKGKFLDTYVRQTTFDGNPISEMPQFYRQAFQCSRCKHEMYTFFRPSSQEDFELGLKYGICKGLLRGAEIAEEELIDYWWLDGVAKIIRKEAENESTR